MYVNVCIRDQVHSYGKKIWPDMECLVIIENENVHKNHLLLLSCSVNLGPLLEESLNM